MYHFRKNLQLLKTKDHSIAQMLLDINKIDEKKLNFHPERNNLVSYLGINKSLKINFGKKNYDIYDNDTLLMCTSGFWENISNPEINEKLKEASDSVEYLDKLQEAIIDSKNPNLNNYTMVSIFVKKAFKENIKTGKLNWKKVLAASLMIITLFTGFTAYRKIKKINHAKYMKIQNLKVIEKTISENMRKEKKAEELALEGNYEEAIKKYDEILEIYETVNIKDKAEDIKSKIKNLKMIIAAKNIEKKADELFKEKKYHEALETYMAAKAEFSKTTGNNIIELESKILNTHTELNTKEQMEFSKTEGESYEKEGDIYFKTENYETAAINYTRAVERYSRIKDYDMTLIQSKIATSNRLKTGKELFEKAESDFERQNYDNAYISYKKSLDIFSGSQSKEKKDIIENKIKRIDLLKEASKYEEEAAEMLKISKFAIAKEKMEAAKNIYSKIQMAKKEKEAQQKINEIDEIVKKGIKANEALQLEIEGDELLTKREYETARVRYNRAKSIFLDEAMNVRAENIDIKIKDIDILKEYHKALDMEVLADSYYSNKNYKKALESYQNAKTMYEKLYKIRDVIAVEEKINKTKDKSKFLGIF